MYYRNGSFRDISGHSGGTPGSAKTTVITVVSCVFAEERNKRLLRDTTVFNRKQGGARGKWSPENAKTLEKSRVPRVRLFSESIVIRVLADADGYNLDPDEGLEIVVPHRAQRAALQQAFPAFCVMDASTGLPVGSAIDTVDRFQGGERTVILVSATESDRAYLLASSEFLLDPRRLTVALSRAKRKMVLVASRSVFSLFSPEEEVFANAQLWKNLLTRACPTKLWEGERGGTPVIVWGGKKDKA
jgi:hypothetical protein